MPNVAQPLLDGRPHLLLHDVDVVVVQSQVSATVLDEPPPHGEDVGLVRLQHLPHQDGRGILVLEKTSTYSIIVCVQGDPSPRGPGLG